MAKTAAGTQSQKQKKVKAPVAASTETSTMPNGIPKNFRQQADIEAFYRFVYENDLRIEAIDILDETRALKKAKKLAKTKVKH